MKENPIDKDKITENPGTLPYAHTIGGVPIKPIDKGRIKGLALQAMYEQTDMQLEQIKKQVQLLVQQAEKIEERKWISEQIYGAEMGFKPLIGKTYFLYKRKNNTLVLSMVNPNEWGRSGMPFEQFISKAKLLADHTWEVQDDENE